MEPEDIISSLSESEEKWWAEKIKEYRHKLVKEPKFYASEILKIEGINKEKLNSNIDSVIANTREKVWQLYLLDEAKFHAALLTDLFKNRDMPKSILQKLIIKSDFLTETKDIKQQEAYGKLSDFIGDYTGRVFPYLYQLSLSTTQSRRSRAGKTFEQLIETIMDFYGFPYDTQSSVGTDFFDTHKLGKKVDLLVPSAEKYIQNRSKSAVVTIKTTLRERWQEVAEEISRTNIPHIYLLTVDRDITSNIADTIKQYNIMLVVYGDIKKIKFRGHDNVESFSEFFTREIPHIISYWYKGYE